MISRSNNAVSLKIFLLVAATMFVAVSVRVHAAAWTTERLTTQLSAQSDDDFISVLVFMNGQLDLAQTQDSYGLAKSTRQAAHKIVVQELQRFAETSQIDIRRALDTGISVGAVKSYERYWIASAFQVEAKTTFIEEMIERADVAAVIEDVPLRSLYGPPQQQNPGAATAHPAVAPINLRAIGADSMWALGFTGQGRLICSFDTGVEGTHPALADSWRGLTHTAAESWFDPIYEEEFPHRPNISFTTAIHGTRTMGVLVGKDDNTGDTTGVAFGAQWISACVVDIPGSNYLEAFQWAADPDGNPSTIDDVPDVVNHSWGFEQSAISCLDIFWIAIDNLEALGCVNVFACGNDGSAAMTLRNPANRATTETNSFSVGGTDPVGNAIWVPSSRGPSDCDSVSIKPEVVAPGLDVYTTTNNSATGQPEYILAAGTSFAAPHVSGAVALLRQVNPNATVEEIKLALMNSANDRGVSGEDNTYGHGLINIPAAMALLPPIDEVNIFVQSLEHAPVSPGEEFEFVVNLKNSGLGTTDVDGELLNPGQGVTIVSDAASFGNMPMNGTSSNSLNPFSIEVSNDFLDGEFATVDLMITDGSSYQNTVTLFFRVGSVQLDSKVTIEADSVRFTVTNYGIYGLAVGSAYNDGGVGFFYDGTNTNNLYQCSFLLGVAEDSVSDAVFSFTDHIDIIDFIAAPGGNIMSYDNGALGDHETFSRFDDSRSFTPIGVTVEHTTATYDGVNQGNFVVLEYTLINEGDTPINGLYAGMFFDWDFPSGSGGLDRVNLYRSSDSPDIGYMWQHAASDYRATAVLNDEGASTFWGIWNEDVIYDGITEAEKYRFLTNGFMDTTSFTPGDQSYSIACGPFNLDPGESDTVAFAIIAAGDLNSMVQYATEAQSEYRIRTPISEDHDIVLPREFALAQNYPNPFNPVTQISFTLPVASQTRLTVINSLGQKVATLSDQMRMAGNHTVIWNGLNDSGEQVASGVYFYRLETEEFVETRKMLLMK